MSNTETSYTAQLSHEIDAAHAAYKAGEPGSDERLYAAFHAQARNVLRYRLGGYDRTLEEEITHRALLALGKFRGESGLSTWFYRLALNETNREFRRLSVHRGRFVSIEAVDEDGEPILPELPAKAANLDAPLDRAQLTSALPPEQAEVLRLVKEGYKLSEIAEKTGTPIGTVRSRYARAKKKARAEGI